MLAARRSYGAKRGGRRHRHAACAQVLAWALADIYLMTQPAKFEGRQATRPSAPLPPRPLRAGDAIAFGLRRDFPAVLLVTSLSQHASYHE